MERYEIHVFYKDTNRPYSEVIIPANGNDEYEAIHDALKFLKKRMKGCEEQFIHSLAIKKLS